MPNSNQVLVITVKDTELTAVLPTNDDGTIDIGAVSRTAVNLFKAYLDGFTTLKDHEKKVRDGQMGWYFDTTFHNLDGFCKDPTEKKFHFMKKIADIKKTEHNFCLCYQRVTMVKV